MIRKEACSDFNFLTVLRLVLCPIIWSILEKVSHVLEKNVYSAAHNYFIYCYFVVPVLGAYIVITIVFLMNFSFIIIYCPFCLLLPFFFPQSFVFVICFPGCRVAVPLASVICPLVGEVDPETCAVILLMRVRLLLW